MHRLAALKIGITICAKILRMGEEPLGVSLPSLQVSPQAEVELREETLKVQLEVELN